MELNQLEYFRVLCKYGSYTQASRELHVTQPAISMAVRRLEDEVGELINHDRKTFTLTPKGEVLLSWAIKLHNDVDSMLRDLSAFSLRQREIIRVAMPFPLCRELLAEGFSRFYQNHTDISLHLMQEGHTAIVTSLLDGTVDLGIICGDMLAPALDSRPYKRMEYYACFPRGHRFDGADAVTPEMLRDETLIIPHIANSISQAIREYFRGCDFQPNFRFVDVFPADVWQLAEQGEGVVFMPGHDRRPPSAPLDPPLYSDLVVAWARSESLTKNQQELVDYISSLHAH